MNLPPEGPFMGGRRYSEAPARPDLQSLENPTFEELEDAESALMAMQYLPSGELLREPLEEKSEEVFFAEPSGHGAANELRVVRVVISDAVIDMAFAPGPRPWLLSYSHSYDAWLNLRKEQGKPVPKHPLRGSDSVVFSNWSVDILDSAFTFVPPADAARLDNVTADLSAMAKAAMPKPELKGQVAPSGTLKLLDGRDLSIEQARSGRVLVLDFWATWCVPCVTSVPTVERVVGEFDERGVSLIAVNCGETEEKVRRAVKDHGWSANVGLDESKAVCNAYHVKAVPILFVIGKNGVIAEVLSGATTDLDQHLRDAIKAASIER
jgi:thiol-disulfide isomerase/thioredoxin